MLETLAHELIPRQDVAAWVVVVHVGDVPLVVRRADHGSYDAQGATDPGGRVLAVEASDAGDSSRG